MTPSPTTSGESKPLTFISLFIMLMNAAGLLVVGPVVGVMNYFLRGTFNDYAIKLPGLTVFFLNTPWWVWCLVFLPPAVVVLVLEFAVDNKRATVTINLAIGGLMLVFLACYVLAMLLPMVAVMAGRVR